MPQFQGSVKVSQCRFRQKAKLSHTGGSFSKASYSVHGFTCSNLEHRGLCAYHGGAFLWCCKWAKEKNDILPQQGKV